MSRGKEISRTEGILIRLAVDRGVPISKIANELGRSRSSIYKRIKRMEETGETRQLMLDLGLKHE